MGDIITTINIPIIKPMGQDILHFTWIAPDPSNYSFNNEPFHFCLLARIDHANDPMYNERTTGRWNLGPNVKDNNNIIWKNLSIIDLNPLVNNPNGGSAIPTTTANFFVGNTTDSTAAFDFVFETIPPRNGNDILNDANITITLEDEIWNKWENQGFSGDNVEIIDFEQKQIRINGDPASLTNLSFEENERYQMNLKFNIHSDAFPFEKEYDYIVRQKLSGNGLEVGGEGFKIYPPSRYGIIADAGSDRKVAIGDSTELRAVDINEPADYKWYDLSGNLISSDMNFFVSPTINTEYLLEVTALNDGMVDYDKVKVDIKTSQILSISPNPATNIVTVDYELGNVNSAQLVLIQTFGATYTFNLNTTLSTINIDISNFNSGLYHVALICDGVSMDSDHLYKN
jgi:hypothetical protein